jgi:hypothetical protein
MYYSLRSPDLGCSFIPFLFPALDIDSKNYFPPTRVSMEAFTCDALSNTIY